MNKLTYQQQKKALTNSIRHFKFDPKYFIQETLDGRIGKKFAIASNSETGGVNVHTRFMTYYEFNTIWFAGYLQATQKPFN